MAIYLNKDGQESGPFEDDVVRGQLQSGQLTPGDMGIRQGDAAWQTLGELFPGVAQSTAVPAAVSENVSVDTTSKKGGGGLKGALLGLGVLALILGVVAAIGSRFIPSVSCDLAESDHKNIVKLQADLDKAKKNDDSDKIELVQRELDGELSGARASQEYCDQDKLRNNVICGGGVVVAFVGLLMSVIGLFVGRRK